MYRPAYGGGILIARNANLQYISTNFIIEILTGGYGGAIYNGGGHYKIFDARIDSNSSNNQGGGIYSVSGSSDDVPDTLINVKIRFNTAEEYGGGLYIADNQAVYSENFTSIK